MNRWESCNITFQIITKECIYKIVAFHTIKQYINFILFLNLVSFIILKVTSYDDISFPRDFNIFSGKFASDPLSM